jgi:hypothetical protein
MPERNKNKPNGNIQIASERGEKMLQNTIIVKKMLKQFWPKNFNLKNRPFISGHPVSAVLPSSLSASFEGRYCKTLEIKHHRAR